MDNTIEVTNYHLQIAKTYGESIAKAHVLAGKEPVTEEELWDEFEQDDIVWVVTGEKPHDVPEHFLILDSFEEGYYYADDWADADE